jgi:hypothetical protein
MQVRTKTKEELSRMEAKVSVLEGLVGRFKVGPGEGTEGSDRVIPPNDEEVERELQMVGLRQRTKPDQHHSDATTDGNLTGASSRLPSAEYVQGKSIGWKEVFFGRKNRLTTEEQEEEGRREWQESESETERRVRGLFPRSRFSSYSWSIMS